MRDEEFIESIPTAGDISRFIYPIHCNDNSALILQVWDKFLEALHLLVHALRALPIICD